MRVMRGRPNGVVSTSGDATTVQWATILAPPVTLSATTFRLVAQVKDFSVPSFDVAVQPGVVTDPSLQGLFAAQLEANPSMSNRETATIQAVADVGTQVAATRQLVGSVYDALSQNAATLGTQTYQDLQSGSASVLGQLEATSDQLDALGGQTQAQMQAAQGSVQDATSAMLDDLNRNVLGSTTDPLALTGSSVAGCQVTMPQLGDGAPHTLASSIRLMQTQLATLMDAFADPTSPSVAAAPGESENCRAALVETLRQTVGTPGAACPADPSTPGSIMCIIQAAQTRLTQQQTDLSGAQSSFAGQLANLGVPQLAGQATSLQTNLNQLGTDVQTAQTELAAGTADIASIAAQLDTDLTSATTAVTGLRSIVTAAQDPDTGLPAITVQILGPPGSASIQGRIDTVTTRLNTAVTPQVDTAMARLQTLQTQAPAVASAASAAQTAGDPLAAGWSAAQAAASAASATPSRL